MHKVIYIVLFSLLFINTKAQDEPTFKLDSVVVSANRVPVLYSEIGRSVEIINKKQLELLPATNVQDLLENISGLDIKQRGPGGIQADVSIRGGSFEQTLILIDGIKLIDPQTGHHNMNLPIAFSQIEKIEILKGQGSRVYGANAFGGVINIIPKRNTESNLLAELSGGENGYYDFGLSGSLKLGNSNHNIAYNKSNSDGYRHNTEFTNHNFSINNSINMSTAVIKTIFGYADKDFGANSYYTTRFPDQAEKTKTYLAGISGDVEIKDFNLTPKIYWRKNEDEFVLRKNDPSFYKNNHESNVYGAELQASTNILGGSTSFGIEYTQDQIVSNNLGEHKRETKGFFIEQKVTLATNLNLSLGGFAYYYSQINWKFWPGIDVAYNLSTNVKLFANYGRAFRVPSYTALYYNDPVTQGNSDLAPEESNNYELGINFNDSFITLNSSYFRKEGRNLIDYVLDTSDDFWKAKNFTRINTYGFELGVKFNLKKITNNILQNIKVDYTYLNLDKEKLGSDSRYVLEHLRHDLSINIFHNLPFDILQSWTLNYENRVSLEDHLTIDTKISKRYSLFSLFVKASNIFNKSYEEIPGVPLPGRWIIGGIKFNIL